MEALFSDFHVSNVGVGMVGCCHGHQLGHLVVVWTYCVCEVGVLNYPP